MASLLAAFCIVLPYARIQLPVFSAFIPINATITITNDLITAALLIAQFWVVRWTWLLVLASGFLFTALIFVPFALTFPGVFAPSGLLGAGVQSAAWLSIALYLSSPLALVVAILVRNKGEAVGTVHWAPSLAVVSSIVLVTATVWCLTWAIIANDENLPQIFPKDSLRPYGSTLQTWPIIAAEVIALVLLWRRGRSVLDLWLMVMCCAWLFVITIGGVFAGSRYSLGFYAGRIVQMAATYIVLLLLLSETTALYANMVRAAVQRRGARQARQIAMDAMAASIGHEIKQPLTALITNGSAGMRLTKAKSDSKEEHAIFSDMVADAQRIGKIIGSVRTMFKDSTHNREPLNLNTVVRDALSAVGLDLRLQHVMVKTELDNDLPSVLADSGQLHHVFLNLITNAMEAMTGVTGRPRVLTLTSKIVAESSEIAVSVEDAGSGIAAKDGDQIFEPFFSTKVAGTGVGLTVCQVVIKAHGGRLEVRANRPYGTIFRVVLPMTGAE